MWVDGHEEALDGAIRSWRVACSANIHHNHPDARRCQRRATCHVEGRPFCAVHQPTTAPASHGPVDAGVKRAAREAVAYARKTGVLSPRPCEVCGAGSVQAHHDDYRKPLDVRWLCPVHHAAVHIPTARTRTPEHHRLLGTTERSDG